MKINLRKTTKQIIQEGSLKQLFDNDEEFIEAINDAMMLEKLKTPTKFSIKLEDLESQLLKT